jgi:hypothetical protein
MKIMDRLKRAGQSILALYLLQTRDMILLLQCRKYSFRACGKGLEPEAVPELPLKTVA